MASAKKGLKEYQSNRDFTQSPEPKGSVRKKSKKKPTFVIHKHDATRLHYDVRLEIEGVMPSWAVPKGLSLDPKDKRLAVRTPNHPLEYAKFEGVIPDGQYGAGPVMIWDYGTYENIKKQHGKLVPMSKCLKDGQIEVALYGQKIEGNFALIRTALSGDKENWLLIKMKDEYASVRRNPTKTQNKSAVSGRTMRQIAKDA